MSAVMFPGLREDTVQLACDKFYGPSYMLDNDTRAVFADWLQDRGETVLANGQRYQLEHGLSPRLSTHRYKWYYWSVRSKFMQIVEPYVICDHNLFTFMTGLTNCYVEPDDPPDNDCVSNDYYEGIRYHLRCISPTSSVFLAERLLAYALHRLVSQQPRCEGEVNPTDDNHALASFH